MHEALDNYHRKTQSIDEKYSQKKIKLVQ